MNGMRDEPPYHWCIDSARVMIRFYFRCFVVVVITETFVHIVWEVLVPTKPFLRPFVLHIDLWAEWIFIGKLFVFVHEQVCVREYVYVDLSVCENL